MNPERSRDHSQNALVRLRSGGQCEVCVPGHAPLCAVGVTAGDERMPCDCGGMIRCQRRATEIHHLIGGWRRRGRGLSVFAEHKQHVCAYHHRAITGTLGFEQTKLRLVKVGPHPRYTDVYEWR